MVLRVLVMLLLGGCAAGPRARAPAPRDAPPAAVAAPARAAPGVAASPGPGAADAGVPPAPASPGLITDEECLARGGTIETEQTYAHERSRDPDAPLHPYRVCRIPSPQNGNVCRGAADCGLGRCFCTGELSGPDVGDRRPDLRGRDRTPATGICSDQHLPSGSWFCLVENGRVVLDGIIID